MHGPSGKGMSAMNLIRTIDLDSEHISKHYYSEKYKKITFDPLNSTEPMQILRARLVSTDMTNPTADNTTVTTHNHGIKVQTIQCTQ
jgi:hypothetical protein